MSWRRDHYKPTEAHPTWGVIEPQDRQERRAVMRTFVQAGRAAEMMKTGKITYNRRKKAP